MIAGSVVDALLKGGKSAKVKDKPSPDDIINTILGSYDDLEHVVDAMRQLIRIAAKREYVKEAHVRRSRWFSRNWHLVEHLADRLLKEGRIDRDDVAAEMGRLECTNMYDPGGNAGDLGVSEILAAARRDR